MKKITLAILIVLILAVFTAIAISADASGDMVYTHNSSVIVNNSWEYKESTKTLTIVSNTSSYNESGRASYDKNGAWGAYQNEIEHVVLMGNFTKITGSAFEGYTALKDVLISSNTQQFDGKCFNGCTNLESISIRGSYHIAGFANLKNAKIIRSGNNFAGTKLTSFNVGSGLTFEGITEYNMFAEGSTIYCPAESDIYTTLSETGLFTMIDCTPVNIKIIYGDTEIDTIYEYGYSSTFPTVNGDAVALFYDSDFKEPFGGEILSEDTTFYAKPIITFLGSMVRIEDYHGLRAIFSYDQNVIEAIDGYTIKEYGAISKKMTDIHKELFIEDNDTYQVKIYDNGFYTGSLLSMPENGVTKFAYTATGFEKDGVLSVDNAESNLLFRGYVILVDANGNEKIGYTDISKLNLATSCEKTIKANNESGNTLLSSEAEVFVNSPLEAGAVPNYIYTKAELLDMLESVYNDPNHYIPAQHLGVGKTVLSDYLVTAHNASGYYPAMVSFDFENMTNYNDNHKILVESMKEYVEKGGIVSFSYHMENPTGNYTDKGLCRGELGGETAWNNLITPGTSLNTKFNEILDKAAVILKDFDDEGYPVIWRPLHEMNGDWFWWCAIQGWDTATSDEYAISQETFRALWIYIYEYFTETWGMKNLVWAYSPSPTPITDIDPSKKLPVMYCYPGDEYCDIVGSDWYVDRDTSITDEIAYNYNIEFAYEKLMESGKPVALTEFGPGSGSLKADTAAGEVQEDYFSCRDQLEIVKRMQSEGLNLTYVLNWSSWISMHELGYMDELMKDETALDLYEIKAKFDTYYKNR